MSDHGCDEDDSNSKCIPGDLLWTKVGSHPFWPCMVTYDPFDGSYTKCVLRKCKEQIIYHVQYFGETVQRGWTLPGNSFPFKGEQAYLNLVAKLKAKRETASGGVSKAFLKVNAKYNVPMKSKDKWSYAVNEAEEALQCTDVKERFQTYVFNFENVKIKKPALSYESSIQVAASSALGPQTENGSKRLKLLNEDSGALCDVCEKNGVEFSCNGLCAKFFHMLCVGMTNMPENFKCAECSLGDFSCFACKKTNGNIIKCSRSKCYKYYHRECLNQSECYNKEKNVCPLHMCVTCCRENPRNIMSHKGAMVKCVRCPTAFHSRESCIAAGSKELTASFILCPYHFVGKQRVSRLKPCNMNLCTLCGEGGELVCCEACPNAFHESCLETGVPTDDFICEDCKNKRYLLYGMIVWVKIGKYRWWPAKIMHPSKLPDNIKGKVHYDGEFAIQYYGTYDYSWTHSGCTFPYDADHKNLGIPRSGKFQEQYKKSLVEAADAYDLYQALRSSESLSSQKPALYKIIKTNRALPPVQITTVDTKSILQCSCDPSKENPCDFDSNCLNRSMLIECHPDVCKAKEQCRNQKFQKRQYAPTEIIKTKDRGWGLAAVEDIKKGVFIIEYVGEVITHGEYRRRSEALQTSTCSNYYFLYLDYRRMIDAGPMGNSSRFINHSCDPNCEMVKWSVNGDARIGIFALKDIVAGEELAFDYQSDKYEFEQKCFCAALNCKGFIGRKSMISKVQTLSSNKSTMSKSFLKISPKVSSLKTYSIDTSVAKTSLKPYISETILKPSTSGTLISKNLFPQVKLTRVTIENSSLSSSLPISINSEKIARKRKSSPPLQRINESDNRCFTCKNPGTLVLCDKKGCIRAYHINCVNLSAVPPGEWICPLHFCNICKSEAVVICCSCPTSFCHNCWNARKPSSFICQICEIKSRAKV